MTRRSFRGAGGAGAVVLPYEPSDENDHGLEHATDRALTDGDQRLEGVLAVVASGLLVAIAAFVAAWALG